MRPRSRETEILDDPGVSEAVARQAYRELHAVHRRLGNTAFIVDAIRRDPQPVRRVLDIGCAAGDVLQDVREQLCVEAIGVDVVPRHGSVMRADAIRDPLPQVDVAFCTYLAHHLTDQELIALIRNVGRSARRFIVLDLVRHRLPAALFRAVVAPFSSPVVVADGIVSFRRAYTRQELAAVTSEALGASGSFRHSMTRMRSRQVVDITY